MWSLSKSNALPESEERKKLKFARRKMMIVLHIKSNIDYYISYAFHFSFGVAIYVLRVRRAPRAIMTINSKLSSAMVTFEEACKVRFNDVHCSTQIGLKFQQTRTSVKFV